jgi:hypothetical protein
MVVFPPFRLDTEEGRLWKDETQVALRKKPFAIRMRGELQEPSDPAAAGRDYREALALARSTGAVGLERRAAASLAALEAR